MNISLIVACDMGDAIGYNNDLLVKISPDLKRFKQLTLNKDVIMGRKTYESLGKPLKDRNNIVLTSNTSLHSNDPNVHFYNDFEQLLLDYQRHGEGEEIFIIGGSSIYKLFLPYANRIYLTRINHYFEEADSYFPHINPEEWQVDEMSDAYEYNGFSYRYIDMSRTQSFIK
jgi:dihydrofolate reductase